MKKFDLGYLEIYFVPGHFVMNASNYVTINN